MSFEFYFTGNDEKIGGHTLYFCFTKGAKGS